ncbi:MAG: cytochrome b/b6 domain-containing protein [Solirubrobacteraceae bacterium]|nr:cytochrome b/b6 domain-containing protein [Solirubrobacteraceae bacterium]
MASDPAGPTGPPRAAWHAGQADPATTDPGIVDHSGGELGPLTSSARTPEERALGRKRVMRFSATERVLHATNGVAFLLLLLTGLALFLPFVAQLFGNRPVVKAVHLAVAALWLTAILLTAILGDRRVLRRTRVQFESLSAEDLRWLRSSAARARPQGKFNGGQKFHAVLQGALTFLFFLSGTFMYLGERNTDFRFPGTIALHDFAMVFATIFVIGHIYIAFSPKAVDSLSGMVDGTVPASYAAEHHPRWNPDDDPITPTPKPGPLRTVLAAVVLVAGIVGAFLLAGG